MFLDAAWNRGFVVTGYVSTGASIWVFTGKVLVISDLVAGHAYWFQEPLVKFLPTLPSRPQLRWCMAPQFNSQQGFCNLCLGRL